MKRVKAVSDQLATTAGGVLLYTVPAGKVFTVTAAHVVNTSATASVLLNIWLVATGGATTDAEALKIDGYAVENTKKKGEGIGELLVQTLEAGDMIYANADTATALTLTISGIEEAV